MTPDTSSATTSTPDVRWKRWLRRILLFVSCVCLVLAVITLWLHIQIDNTDRFVRTVEPAASDTAIQEAIVDTLTNRFSARLSEAQARDGVVDLPDFLAGSLNQTLTDFVEETIRSVVTSDQFQPFWTEATRAIHPPLSAILTGDETDNMTTEAGVVVLDLTPLVEAVQNRLTEQGIDIFERLPGDRVDDSIVLFDSPDLAKVQEIIHVLFSLAVLFPIIALVTLGGYLWLSHDRRSGTLCAGLAAATSMAMLLLLLSVARWRYLDGVSADVSQDAAAALFDIIGRYLRAAIRLIALLGLVVAGVAVATRPGGWVARQFGEVRRRTAGGRQVDQTLAEGNLHVLLGAMLAVICLCLITPERLSQDWWRATLLAAVLSLAVILIPSRFGNRVEPASPVDPGPKSLQLVPNLPPATGVTGGASAGADPATGARLDPPAAPALELSDADRELREPSTE